MKTILKKKYNIFNIINVKFFILSLAVGLFYVYVMKPVNKVLVIYPTPNEKNLQYVDAIDNCYEFVSNEVECPTNMNKVKDIPIQKKNELMDIF